MGMCFNSSNGDKQFRGDLLIVLVSQYLLKDFGLSGR